MATHISMAFDQRKNYICHSNFKTPINGLSKISQTQFSQEKSNSISRKEATAQLKLVQEWRSMKTKNMGMFQQSCPNVDDEFHEVQPFSEEPVSFDFGDDYGNQLFLDLQQELYNNWLSQWGREINRAVEGMKYTSDDIYILSPEAGMITAS